MHMDGAKFVFNASDFIGTGAIHVPVFEKEILDLTRQRGVAFQRIRAKKATGHPTRYMEKLVHVNKAGFVDPRVLNHAQDTTANRVEKSALVRALVNGITFSKFDVEVTEDQDLFNDLVAEDLQDMILDMGRMQDEALWVGDSANLMDGTKAGYTGLLTQISRTGEVANGVRLTQAIKSQVAQLTALKGYDVKPSAIYMNPLTLDLLENEELNADDKVKYYEVEVVAGIKVIGIMTSAGILPIICDPFLPIVDGGATNDHKIVIATESLLERHYVKSDVPRLYQMGTVADLAQRFTAVQFDTVIAKGADYAHATLTKKVTK